MDTLRIIDQIEVMVEEAKKFMGFTRLDEDHFFQLTSKLRASLPEDVRRAGKLAENTDRLMEQAQEQAQQSVEEARAEAERMLAAARVEAERLQEIAHKDAGRTIADAKGVSQTLTDQSEITRIATAQAREIIAQAEREAEEVRAGADTYAREILVNLEQQIQSALGQVEGRCNTMLATIQRGRLTLEKAPGERGNGIPTERADRPELVGAGSGRPYANSHR